MKYSAEELSDQRAAAASDIRPVARHPAVAESWELYHIVHPTDASADLWTPDYLLALRIYEEFVQKHGQAHLHLETLPAGQYRAECLLRGGVVTTPSA